MSSEVKQAWYCARTKPKHEHIAAANVARKFGIEIFSPRVRSERSTRRGPVRTVEPLFPCYIFVHCRVCDLPDFRYVSGISSVVQFGDTVPSIPDSVICELQECFDGEEQISKDGVCPGAEVAVKEGAFRGLQAIVLRMLPAQRRVQVLLDVLGRQTLAELDPQSLAVENRKATGLTQGLVWAG